MLWLAYFGNDERLAVLQSSFQRKPPRRAPVQLDLDVVEGDELLHGLHAAPSLSFSLSVVMRPAAPVAVPPTSPSPLYHQQRIDGGKTEQVSPKRGRAKTFFGGKESS